MENPFGEICSLRSRRDSPRCNSMTWNMLWWEKNFFDNKHEWIKSSKIFKRKSVHSSLPSIFLFRKNSLVSIDRRIAIDEQSADDWLDSTTNSSREERTRLSSRDPHLLLLLRDDLDWFRRSVMFSSMIWTTVLLEKHRRWNRWLPIWTTRGSIKWKCTSLGWKTRSMFINNARLNFVESWTISTSTVKPTGSISPKN